MHVSSVRSMLQGAALCFVLFNGTITNKSSTDARENPAVNCKGSLTEKDCGDVYTVENITIGGLYKQIRVFVAPSCFTSPVLDKDITKHYAYLDLDKLSKLETGNAVTYGKKNYITLHVYDKAQAKTEYFIETSKMVEYTVSESTESDRRKISIEKVQTITFGTCAEQTKKQESSTKKA